MIRDGENEAFGKGYRRIVRCLWRKVVRESQKDGEGWVRVNQ